MNTLESSHRAVEFCDCLQHSEFADKNGASLSLEQGMAQLVAQLEQTRDTEHIYVIGNGGSAVIAVHMPIDLLNVGRPHAYTLHDAPVLSYLSNDYGYENAFSQAITLSGFSPDDPLQNLGDPNIWMPMSDYRLVETAHAFILHNTPTVSAPPGKLSMTAWNIEGIS